jgi:hypothetical protein
MPDFGGSVGVLLYLVYILEGSVAAERLTRSVATPEVLSTPAAIVANAPPRLCPVTTTWYSGFSARACVTASVTTLAASSHELQKPPETSQSSQNVDGVVRKEKSVIQFCSDLEPRNATTMSFLVLSRATKPVTSVSLELIGCQ